jgi:hypothetical protein
VPVVTWIVVIGIGAAVLAFILQSRAAARRTFEPELRRALTASRATLVAVRRPRLTERSPFPALRLVTRGGGPRSGHTRIATVRTADGREHTVWARIDLDPSRPAAGLDSMQIEFSPRISELHRG